jgi:hypothetical protein
MKPNADRMRSAVVWLGVAWLSLLVTSPLFAQQATKTLLWRHGHGELRGVQPGRQDAGLGQFGRHDKAVGRDDRQPGG